MIDRNDATRRHLLALLAGGAPGVHAFAADLVKPQPGEKDARTPDASTSRQDRSANAEAVSFLQAGSGAVGRSIQDKLRDIVSVKDFGAIGDGKADDTAAFARAFSVGLEIWVPRGTYSISGTLVVPPLGILRGAGAGATTISISADKPAIILQEWSQLVLLTVTRSGRHTSNLVEIGGEKIDGGRATISNVRIERAGQDGLQIKSGNLGLIENLTSIDNGRDGLHFAAITNDANAWTANGFNDIRGNGRDGVHLASSGGPLNSTSNMLRGLVVQNNVRYGAYFNTRGNLIEGYGEFSGSGADFYFDKLARGNELRSTNGTIRDNSTNPEFNLIWTDNASGGYQRALLSRMLLSGNPSAGWQIFNDDGTPGSLRCHKVGGRHYAIATDNSGGLHTVQFAANDGPTNWEFGGNVYPSADNAFAHGGSGRRWAEGRYVQLILGTGAKIVTGAASPEGRVAAAPGSIFINENGGLWRKARGVGNAGWAEL